MVIQSMIELSGNMNRPRAVGMAHMLPQIDTRVCAMH